MKKFYLQTKYGKILTPIEQQRWEEPEDGERTFDEQSIDCVSDESFMIGNNIIHEVVYSVSYINGVVIIRWVNGKLHAVRKIENIYDY